MSITYSFDIDIQVGSQKRRIFLAQTDVAEVFLKQLLYLFYVLD